MDGIFEKYSVFDFFNVICTGLIALVGISLMGVDLFGCIARLGAVNESGDGAVSAVIYVAIMLGCGYLLGSCIQSLSSRLQQKLFRIENRAITTCLVDPSVIGNSAKFQVFTAEALRFFESKQIDVVDGFFTPDQCKYFFAHCVYYIQVKGQNAKTEKMRELCGISNMLATCFALLFLGGTVAQLAAHLVDCSPWAQPISWWAVAAADGVFAILALVFWYRMKRSIFDRLRMVLGVYDACMDAEKSEDMPIE